MKNTEIYFDKVKIFLMFLGSSIFVLTSTFLFFISETRSETYAMNAKFVAVLGLFFFGFAAFYSLSKFFDRNPALTIDPEGIIDRSSLTAVGRILWSEVASVSSIESYLQNLIIVKVSNTDEMISRQSGLKKMFMKINNKWFGSQVIISSVILKSTPKQLFALIESSFEQSKKR